MDNANYNPPKKLYRSRKRVIGGVCQGLADYFNADVVPIRLLAVLGFLCGTLGFWVYLIFWIVIPNEPRRSGNNGR